MQKILVVDDVEINRELLHNILKDDYIIEMAGDGEQAIQKLKENQGKIAAILLDLQMPKKDGFAVIADMKKNGWMPKLPVLVISGEYSVEVENQCFELGVSDFIHKPFESSIVKNRIRNTLELFAYKNQLEQKVEEQEEKLKRQHELIEKQAQKLRRTESFNRLMMEYRAAIREVETRLLVLNEEFSQEYNRNPFESIKSRLKTATSIYEKLERKGFPIAVESIREDRKSVV